MAVPARDTVKWSPRRGEGDGGDGCGAQRLIERTLSRDAIYLAQTPQAFRRDVLRAAVALGRGGVEATDEAALAEQAGHPVRLVEGSARNIKVTTVEDLVIAEALLKDGGAEPGTPEPAAAAVGQPSAGLRVGAGYDLHRLVEGRPLVLGGVTVPFDRGLAGHSDADVLCHAITDAVLGAAAAGDIGQHFPDTDERWRGASSLDLLTTGDGVVRRARVPARQRRRDDHRGAAQAGAASRAAIVTSLAGALGVSARGREREGQDQRRRGRHGSRHGHRGARGRAAAAHA